MYDVEMQMHGPEALSVSDAKTKELLFCLDSEPNPGVIKINQNLNTHEKADLLEVMAFFVGKYMDKCNMQRESIKEMQAELDRLNRIVYTV